MELRTLYNALRMNKYGEPSPGAEEWQLLDYRTLPFSTLFTMLSEYDLYLDRDSFIAYAEHSDNPEGLTESFIADAEMDKHDEDRIFLIIFELWRRLVPEKRCVSIFCDELDTQIHAYDTNHLENPEPLEDILANLRQILEDNADLGEDPQQMFVTISENCANNIESFLFDFIGERIDHNNYGYAGELIDDFEEIVGDPKWLDFLRIRLAASVDPEDIGDEIHSVIKKTGSTQDIDFNLEVLEFLVQDGERHLFIEVLKNTIPLAETEEDFTELLSLSADYFRCLDKDEKEKSVNAIIDKRSEIPLEASFDSNDPDIKELRKVLRASPSQ